MTVPVPWSQYGFTPPNVDKLERVIPPSNLTGGSLATDKYVSKYKTDLENAGFVLVPPLDEFGKIITPEQFGAIGDGVTDDTVAFQAAVDAIRVKGRGTLVLDSQATYLISSVNIQAGLVIEGRNARILRPAMTPNWTRTFTTQNRNPDSADELAPIVLKQLTIDGNLANQGPYSNFELEQAMLVLFTGGNNYARRLPVVLEDVTVQNSVSDGVHLLSNVDATIRNLKAVNCFRGGLTLSGGNTRCNLTGYEGTGSTTSSHIDIEIDSTGFGGTKKIEFTGRNIKLLGAYGITQGLQLTAYDNSIIDIQYLEAIAGYSIFAPSGSVTVRDSIVYGYEASFKNTILAPTSVLFDNVTFVANASTSTPGIVRTCRVTHFISGQPNVPRNLIFRDCSWVVGTVNVGDTVRAVSVAPTDYANNDLVTINSGQVTAEHQCAFRLESGGRLIVKNRPVISANTAIQATSAAGSGRQYYVSVEQLQLNTGNVTYMQLENSDIANIVEHLDTVLDETKNTLTTVSGWNNNTARGRRIIMSTSAPTTSTKGIKGDVVRLKTPVPGETYEWVCTTGSSGTGNVWKPATALAL